MDLGDSGVGSTPQCPGVGAELGPEGLAQGSSGRQAQDAPIPASSAPVWLVLAWLICRTSTGHPSAMLPAWASTYQSLSEGSGRGGLRLCSLTLRARASSLLLWARPFLSSP